jgi:hypothetical protein
MLLKEALSPILKRAVKQGRLLAKSKSTFRHGISKKTLL